MALMSSPWRALRPALLAGAAAVTWLTLSSTAATAGAGPDSSSLLGGITSSVSSLAETVTGPAQSIPTASASDAAASTGVLQPVAAPVSALADDLIASVPVVSQVIPAGTVSTVSAPIAGAADSLAADVAEVAVAPVAESVPALEPVLQPVSDLLTGVEPLPVQLPELPAVVSGPELPTSPADAAAGALPGAAATDSRAVENISEADDSAAEGSLPGSMLQPASQGAARLAATTAGQSAPAGIAVEDPLSLDPSPLPAQAPAAPGSGTGSGGSPAGPSGAAAWLNSFDYLFRIAGAVLGLESPEHAPAPVSFDPGSSPD